MNTILFVHAPGGVPLDHAVPRMAAQGEVHFLSSVVAPPGGDWTRLCASSQTLPPGLRGEDLVRAVVARAQEIDADAIVTWSEYLLLAVTEAAARLGLRNAGPNVALSRDKAAMRATWAACDVPVPRFTRVGDRTAAQEAMNVLGTAARIGDI